MKFAWLTDKRIRILEVAIGGFLLGLIAPIIGILFELNKTGANLSIHTIRNLPLEQPLLILLYTAPLILSIAFSLISMHLIRVNERAHQQSEWNKERELQALNESYYLEALVNNSSFAIVRLDIDYKIITCNQAFEDLFGYPCDEIRGKHLDEIITSQSFHSEASQLSNTVLMGNLVRKPSKRMRKDGSLVDVEIIGVPVTAAGEIIGILGLYHDISPRKQAEQALLESEYRFKTLFDQSPVSLWEEDFSDVKDYLDKLAEEQDVLELLNDDKDLVKHCLKLVKIIDVNKATIDLYQATTKSDLLTNLGIIVVDESLEEFKQELMALVRGEHSFECEIIQKKLSGDYLNGWLRLSVPPGYEDSWEKVYISIVDITDRKRAEEKLRFMSYHDALTGVYNRAYFEEELRRLQKGRQFPVSIIACDLDGLKQINDTHGHEVGDQAIIAAANILGSHTLRKGDFISRIGGDEFVIILPDVDLNQSTSIMQRLRDGVSRFNNGSTDDGLYRPISISFGYAVVNEGDTLIDGYNRADQAMYANKMKKK